MKKKTCLKVVVYNARPVHLLRPMAVTFQRFRFSKIVLSTFSTQVLDAIYEETKYLIFFFDTLDDPQEEMRNIKPYILKTQFLTPMKTVSILSLKVDGVQV